MLHLLLKKLIKTASGRVRFYLSIVGISIATLLILASVQLQVNYNELLHSKANQDSIANFLLVNKSINTTATVLTQEEINDIKKQSFIDAVGLLTPSRFKVSAQSTSAQFPLYTDLFLEAVPDEFLDINPQAWKWDENSTYVPLIIPSMFLDMYNFGFAISQGTPQLTKEAIQLVPIKLNIYHSLFTNSYPARIVGFSDRISSVLVPQAFMDWANTKFGNGETKSSRVIIRTKDPSNPQLINYLRAHQLTTNADNTRFSKYRKIVDVVVNVSWVSGAIMLLFALLIFTLFIQLTIASCKEEIQLLITLGAAPRQLQQFLIKRFYPVNIVIITITLIITAVLQYVIQQYLKQQQIHLPSFLSVYTTLTALIMLFILWLVNYLSIRNYIYK